MFTLVDTESRENLARVEHLDHARAAAVCVSKDFHRPITLFGADPKQPIARYVDGKEIEPTAQIHHLN
jgi:hypothetical protein